MPPNSVDSEEEELLYEIIDTAVDRTINRRSEEFSNVDLNFQTEPQEHLSFPSLSTDNTECHQLLQTEPFNDDPDGDDDDNEGLFIKTYTYEEQSSLSVLKQMLLPFTLAGFGSTFAGILLNRIILQTAVFQTLPQLEILVPAFIGLIGNIQTTLASRLSTHANLGTLDKEGSLGDILAGNSLVVLCQATGTGLFAAGASIGISAFKGTTRSSITLYNCLLLAASSVLTSIIANVLLSSFIVLVIIGSRRCGANPDNISTPIAASMGDILSLSLLAFTSQYLHEQRNPSLLLALIFSLLLLCPLLGLAARRNRYTKTVILTGWTAILGAVLVEQPGGMVMEAAFQQYKVMATFQPLVNGIGSNLVGIQTSRMSTYLHSITPKGTLPESHPTPWVPISSLFTSRDPNARIGRLLLFILLPAHLFFITLLYSLQGFFAFSLSLTVPFLLLYSAAVLLQLVILLYLATISVFWAWKVRINPDNSAIPFTSALADLLGNCLMAGAFTCLHLLGDPNGRSSSQQSFGRLVNGTSTIL